jgi:hypothetical protein
MTDYRIAVMLNGSESIDYIEQLTNLWRLKSGLQSDKTQAVMYYNVADATASRHTLFRLVMHFTGHGYSQFLEEIYSNLLKKIRNAYYMNHVTRNGTLNISLFGFSDGATLVRHFGAEYIYKRLINEMPIDIKAMGIKIKLDAEYLFDSVRLTEPSPVQVIGRFALLNFQPAVEYNTAIPSETRSYQAVSLDEFDAQLEPVLVDQQSQKNEEVWFAGDHLDVGGGHMVPATAHSPISAHHSLRYIVKRARENGLSFEPDFLKTLEEENKKNALALSELHDKSRQLPHSERQTRAVYVQKEGDISDDLPILHESVIERMSKAPKPYYQPLSLLPFLETKLLREDGSRASARFEEKPLTPILHQYSLNKSASILRRSGDNLALLEQAACSAQTPLAKRNQTAKR